MQDAGCRMRDLDVRPMQFGFTVLVQVDTSRYAEITNRAPHFHSIVQYISTP